MPRSTATTEPLSPPWLDSYRARVDPRLTPIQRLASEAIWAWFDELWMDESRLVDLQDELLALLERIETSTGPLRDEAIVELVDRLRSVDRAVVFRR